MPDVTRSDSQRSDASLRPRVSFNRDVHVKRIVPRESGRAGYLSDGEAYGSLVKKKPLSKSKEKLQKEAAKVVQKVGKLECIAKDNGIPPDKFYTLPVRKKAKKNQANPPSRRRNSTELLLTPPKKPPRTFASAKKSEPPKKPSIFGVFQGKPKKSNLTRSVSDATNLKSRPDKKQLSPIIELTQREDYFSGNVPGERSVTDLLKEYIGELDSAEQGVVVIDVEKAEQISDKSKSGGLGKRLRGFVGRKGGPEMIHSSQKPAEKLPLTRGRTVDNMVKRLSRDNGSPPPKSSVLITPNISVQHNNNQPFSYTRGLSPERTATANAGHPIIYAQVVCGSNGIGGKQTVHTAYSNGKKHLPHSDSDEGLGYEENTGFRTLNVRHFGDDRVEEDFITPSYKSYNGTKYAKPEPPGYFIDSSSRGRGDGMDAKRRESLTETDAPLNVSARRDLLESRINRRVYSPKTNALHLADYRSGSASPEVKHHHNHNGRAFETEPKSFDSHIADYPERLANKRDFYKSSPEIYHHYTSKVTSRKTSEKPYYDGKDKFGDSGIENDLSRRKLSNESEDEGFASSLLIASERQHTEDNIAKQRQQNYDSDTGHHVFAAEKVYRQEYVPRERSIDDGSHFDPRLDRERATLKKTDKKPPKPEKKSSLEKMKQLFSGTKKKKDKPGMVREESLRARYTEYKGGSHTNDSKIYKKDSELSTNYEYNDRRHMSTPSPSSARALDRNIKSEPTHGSWFKSLDRLARKKTKKDQKEGNMTSTEDETTKPTKSLRFFGDTDVESNDSVRRKSALKTRTGLSQHDRTRSQSSSHLHNITEELHNSKSMQNIAAVDSDRDFRSSRLSLKPPASPNHRNREVMRSREDRSRRRKNEVSSVESSTEGDSSQQSQRSVVYLHAATVGDIPGPGYLRNGRRAASREELASNSSNRMQPQVKTLSRSFSVLAPWKPRHYKDGIDIDYTQYPTKPAKNGKYEQNRNGTSRKESSSTLKKRAQETARKSNMTSSTLNRRSRSKENVRGGNEYKGSSSSLYKKKERQPKEANNRYTRDDKRIAAAKSMSVESLGSNRSNNREVSRSVSMPRDPQKSAGWFTMNRKNKKSVSTQRL